MIISSTFFLNLTFVICSLILNAKNSFEQKITDENLAQQWLNDYNREAQLVYYESVLASWIYNTNLTDYNSQKQVEAQVKEAQFDNAAGKNASLFDWSGFSDAKIKRQLAKISNIGSAKLQEVDNEKFVKYQDLLSKMEADYSKARVVRNGKEYNLEPDLTRLLADQESSYDTLLWVWKGWRDATGPKIKPKYKEFVQLSNEAAKLNDYADTGQYWRSSYDVPNYDFQEDVLRLYKQLAPLYQNLHSYVRRKLMQKYGDKKFPKSGHIPAHLLGNMWAQGWNNLLGIMQPYEGKESVDVTPALVEQGYDAKRMFNLSDEFFASLGLIKMPDAFWNNSMIEKPTDGREVVCHASAWDFYNGKDFRIKQCTDVTMEDLVTIHHEMGHVEYYLQYQNLPINFRRGANPGFHEAVGDVLALSVSTPKHLKEIGLLTNVQNDKESDLNYLMSIALDKIAFIPFGYLMDQWRWSVFSGETPSTKYNEKWWELRCKFQGISPPIKRTEEDFDPGSKYHIPGNTPYIRYFVSYVLQFQFHRALCAAANHTGPLYKCDIYRSTEAGKLLGDMLKLGSSEDWPVALEKITGNTSMDATAIIDYFQPLIVWLEDQNKGHSITWDEACPTFPDPTSRMAKVKSGTLISVWFVFMSMALLYL